MLEEEEEEKEKEQQRRGNVDKGFNYSTSAIVAINRIVKNVFQKRHSRELRLMELLQIRARNK